MCICGVLFGFSLSVPSLASLSNISLLLMHVCARTLCMWIICGVQYIQCIMATNIYGNDEAYLPTYNNTIKATIPNTTYTHSSHHTI